MTVLIEVEAKEIAELLTRLFTSQERQIMNIRYPDKCNNRMYSPDEVKTAEPAPTT